MKYFNKFLLLLFSVLVLFGVSVNTYNYVYADDEDVIETTEESDEETEKVSQTIKFLDGEGNPLEIEDTISISTFNQEQPYVFDEDGNPEYSYKVENGEVTFSNLTQGETYYISFDGDTDIEDHFYIFKDEQEDGTYKYHQWASFTAYEGYKYEISFSQLQFLDEYKQELISLGKTDEEVDEILTDIFNTDEVMDLAAYAISFKVNKCPNWSGSYTIKITNVTSDGTTGSGTTNTVSTQSHAWSSVGTFTCTPGAGGGACSVTIVGKGSYTPGNGSMITPTNCDPDWASVCTPNSTQICSNGTSATQYYDGNGGSCGKSSDTRTRSNGSKTCSYNGHNWGSCSTGFWSGSVSAHSCSRGNGTDTRTISFNKNVASDSASSNVTGIYCKA